MFLHLLNNEQKELFLDLAIKAAEANGVVELEEKNLLKAFSIEMQIPSRYKTEKTTDEILAQLSKISNEREKKILSFELIGILLADGTYDDKEKVFITQISEQSNIPIDEIEKMINVIDEYKAVYNKICDIVLR